MHHFSIINKCPQDITTKQTVQGLHDHVKINNQVRSIKVEQKFEPT